MGHVLIGKNRIARTLAISQPKCAVLASHVQANAIPVMPRFRRVLRDIRNLRDAGTQ